MPTRHQGPRSEVRALDVYVKLLRATDALGAYLGKGLRASRLTPGQLAVLEALYHLGPLSQRSLGRKLLSSGPNVTVIVSNLETADLVRRERSSIDRRTVTVSLTPRGRQAIAAAFPPHAARIAFCMAALTPAELASLGRICKKLGLAVASLLEAPGERKPARRRQRILPVRRESK